ncbi:response regulator transcription factor [Anaerosalibacter bizertensis]|uniref:Response regulator transcription factor n=1 Tax=Anaerosalibacter bizertensis TaxID=932217 RepID=A0A9Q4ABH3_9FIRM|nr:response regulator transcription factor [Anaerosalibacter bizertensis]MBV1817815.1 response regulator transcription factor [Bacteroidales bacterium MSK.15.36]MCG4564525.1 response regulator transcription factor [Anaerosalibacter bizertensis]MCG4581415.1 response regulator transcription factor [Anaerosalibacter bizertensis]HHV26864.1 response regulator transcription factor [Tissierellia bacterium]
MNEKILVVDDEEHIVELLKYNLESNGYIVKEAYTGREVLEFVYKEKFDLIILDLMIPEIDGIEVCKILKRDLETSHIPIIMLTAKSGETDKVLGLEIGADDYITKPFSIRELLARVKAVLRRIDKKDYIKKGILKVQDIVIDMDRYEVRKKDEVIDLTYKEFELLKILVENRGKALSRNMLLDMVWGYDYFGETRTVDVHIRNLRKKIEDDDRNPKYIETVRGIGYKLR